MNIKNSILLRTRIAFLVMFLFALGIIYKISHIQMIEGEKWTELAEQTGLQYRSVKATRGNIFSDNGSLMATSVPYYKVAFDPSRVSDRIFQEQIDSLAMLLARFYGEKTADQYKRRIKNARVSGRKYMILSHIEIDYQEKKNMEKWPIFRYGRLDGGVIFEKIDKRFLPFSYLANRTIGYVNDNMQGAGLEYSFNKYLAGKDGESLFQKMSGGNWKPVHGSGIRPKEGYDLETTIDVNLQDVAESALLKALIEHDADHGSLVLMEVKTGEIKAISNLGRTKSGKYAEKYNYAVGRHGRREPGSTFKLATMIALFEETDIKLTDIIETGEGEFKFYDNVVRDHAEGGLGKISIRKAFEMSSNIAMAKLADKYFKDKPAKFYQYLEKMYLTKPLGFQMVGEGTPIVKKPEQWSGITLPWMAYGYGLELSPLHILTFYNAVANNGKMIKPIIVKSVQRTDKIKEEFKSEVLVEQICSDATLNKIKILLEGVVKNGTAMNIYNDHYSIAGKTGTAQLLRNGRHSRNYLTSFAGYFPAENPMYSCIVVIENPRGFRQYGSNVAAPVFKEVSDKVYASNIKMHDPLPKEFKPEQGIFPVVRSGNQEDLKIICNELGISNQSEVENEWVKTETNDNSIFWVENKMHPRLVPDVTGMTLRDAIFLLENSGLKVDFEGEGRVTQQSIYPGKRINEGTTIKLQLG